jgi:ketosteroid isomerase-like protein
MSAVEERLQRIEDRLELLELPARYSKAIDDRDIGAMRDLFCTDGVVYFADGVACEGIDALEEFWVEILSGYGMSIHIPHAQVVEQLAGDEATGWVLAHAELAVGDRYVVAAIRYEDEYRRVDGRWRFASRRLLFWYFTDADELAATIVSPDRKRFRTAPRPADLPESLGTYRAFRERVAR